MKNYFPAALAVIICFLFFVSCQKLNSTFSALISKASGQGAGGPVSPGEDSILYSQPIPLDTANRMIQSYLTSIGYPGNNSEIRSWAFNADTLRNFLNTLDGQRVKYLKFFMAHTQSYINSGHYGQRPENILAADFTLIIAGVDSAGKYVLAKLYKPYDQCMPCPYNCIAKPLIHKD